MRAGFLWVLIVCATTACDHPGASPASAGAPMRETAAPVSTVAAVSGRSRPSNPGGASDAPLVSSTEGQRWEAALRAAMAEWLASPSMQSTARGVLTTALFAPALGNGNTDAVQRQVDAALALAAEMAPDDVEIAWLEATRCPAEATACDAGGAIERLQRLEPDNAAVWLLAGDRTGRGDEAAFDRYLRRAAQASTYDTHFGVAERMLEAQMATLPLPARSREVDAYLRARAGFGPGPRLDDREVRLMLAAGQSWIDMPPFARLHDACRMPQPPGRIATCRSVLTRMADGNSAFPRMIATGLMTELADGTARPAWAERYRVTLWTVMGSPPTPGPELQRALFERGDYLAVEEWLRANGRRMPPDWLPKDPQQRDRILGQPVRPPG